MSINDNGIVDTLKECPENGFGMLMMKYQEPVYWHIRRLVVSHDDAQDASQETFGSGEKFHYLCSRFACPMV